MEPVPHNSVIDFSCNTFDNRADLTVLCNGKQIHISLSVDCFKESPSIKETYLRFIQVVGGFELDDLTEDDFYDWILEPFLPILSRLPPVPEHHRSSLQDYLFPDIIDYTVCIEDDKLVPVLYCGGEARRPPKGLEVSLSPETWSTFPSYHPHQVQICSDDGEQGRSIPPNKVRVEGGDTYFFKAYGPAHDISAPYEIANYKAIEDAGLEDSIRISRLHGIVRDEDSGKVFGVLLTFIDCEGMTLEYAVNPDTDRSLRERWAHQITETLQHLHEHGVVWGDVKPPNVLIDLNNDAWLIDFGGGYTEGWVDKDVAGTLQGDFQGLVRILHFLDVIPLDHLALDGALQQIDLQPFQKRQAYATAASA